MNLEYTPLSNSLGAEIQGLDISKPLDGETIEAVTDIWHKHIVLLFRDQELDEESQLRFAAQFGKLGVRARPPERRPEGADYNASIMLISNVRENGVPIGSLPDGEMWFHHDMCYVEAPYRATMLYGIDIPARGGDTMFTNMYAAYDDLSLETKRLIAGRRALQVYDFGTAGPVSIDDGYQQFKHCFQPVAITHPVTKRKALYVNPLITALIEDMPRDESDALLQELFSFTKNSEIIYSHAWRRNDFIMWDNWCSCHARTDFPATERRLLRRCAILGQPLYEN